MTDQAPTGQPQAAPAQLSVADIYINDLLSQRHQLEMSVAALRHRVAGLEAENASLKEQATAEASED